MEDLAVRLNNIEDSYYGFVVAVLTYVKKKQSRFDRINDFLNHNPTALTSEILTFISEQEDFYEDAALAHAKVC